MNCQPCILPECLRGSRPPITYGDIVDAVCAVYNITYWQMFGSSQKEEIVDARHMAMFMIRKHTKLSLPAIGKIFNRAHATILHACRRIATEKGIYRGVDREAYHKEKYREVLELCK